ncbi:MAG: ATP-binding protein [Kiritimatiellae bacterium]|nr:ATP-binding protein [Kiritimatiellia bacterium]
MIPRETIKKVIVEYQQFLETVELQERAYAFEPKGKYVMVGIRHAGKSYLLYQRARQLMAAGHVVEEFCYVNFDDERLIGMKAEELDGILSAYRSLFDRTPILFFDEIQNVAGWEHFARRLANEKYLVFITGSNAKMLSREIATTLGERYLTMEVMPYSFGEYVRACGVKLGKNWKYGREADAVTRLCENYLRYGGFPEVLDYANKRAWLNGLYGRIFFSDMIVRNGIKNEEALRLSVRKLAESVGQPAAYNRIANLVKAAGASTTTASVRDYVRFMRESCLVFSVANAAAKFAERESVKKHYFIDNGLLDIFLTNPDSALLENACAVALHRVYGDALRFYNHNVEVDFYLPDDGLAVQVCWSMMDPQTRLRELRALEKLNDRNPLKRMVVVTRDESERVKLAGGQVVEVVPLADWLLEVEESPIRERL